MEKIDIKMKERAKELINGSNKVILLATENGFVCEGVKATILAALTVMIRLLLNKDSVTKKELKKYLSWNF